LHVRATEITLVERLTRWHDFPMQRGRRLLGWRFGLITVVVAYTTFFGTALLSDVVYSPMAPASVAKVSVPDDALVAAVATASRWQWLRSPAEEACANSYSFFHLSVA